MKQLFANIDWREEAVRWTGALICIGVIAGVLMLGSLLSSCSTYSIPVGKNCTLQYEINQGDEVPGIAGDTLITGVQSARVCIACDSVDRIKFNFKKK